jgi:hypothetical protein
MRTRPLLGDILVELRVLTPADVGRVLEAVGRRGRPQKFGQMARAMGLVGEEHILAALAVQMNLFPNSHRLSLHQILQLLQTSEASAG